MAEIEWIGVPVEEEGAMDMEERARKTLENIIDNINSLVTISCDNKFISAIPKDLAQRFREETHQLTDIPTIDELLKTLNDIASVLF